MGKFHAEAPGTKPPSQAPGVAEARTSSASWPSSKRPSEDGLPLSSGSLREMLDLPLLGGPSHDPSADAAALFRDDDEPIRRRPSRAEARMVSRNCSACGGIVAPGMSICQNCGLDQETGEQIELAEEIETIGPAVGPVGPPQGLMVVAIAVLVGCAGLGLLSLLMAISATSGLGQIGALALLIVGGFGAFAAGNVLRGRSPRLLLVALALGAIVDVTALIVIPAIQAGDVPSVGVEQDLISTINTQDSTDPSVPASPDLDTLGREYDLDVKRLAMGLVILVLEGVVFAYLMSPAVRRLYDR